MHTPTQVAGALFSLMPRGLSASALAEYGLELAPERAQEITRELLGANLFWVSSALETLLPPSERDRVWAELQTIIRSAWAPILEVGGQDLDAYFRDMDKRHLSYQDIVREGGTPLSVFNETASVLESGHVVQAEDRTSVLALLIDLVPVDEFGDLLEEVDLTPG